MGSTPVASGHKAGITGLALDGTTSETWQLGSASAERWRLSGGTGTSGVFALQNRRGGLWADVWQSVDYGSGLIANAINGMTSLAFNYDAVDAPQNVLTLTANKLTAPIGAGYGVSFTMQAEDSTTEYVGLGGAAWSWVDPTHESRSSKAVLSVIENAVSVDALTITGTGINATPIGSTTASTGAFTTLSSTATNHASLIPELITLRHNRTTPGLSGSSIGFYSPDSAGTIRETARITSDITTSSSSYFTSQLRFYASYNNGFREMLTLGGLIGEGGFTASIRGSLHVYYWGSAFINIASGGGSSAINLGSGTVSDISYKTTITSSYSGSNSSLDIQTYTQSILATRIFVDTSGRVGVSTGTPATILHAAVSSVTTNSVENVLTIEKKLSSGSGAAGLGAGVNFILQSNTTAGQNAARLVALWNDATHASYKTDLVAYANNAAVEYEGWRIRGDGAAKIGFLGATPAARQTGGAQTATGTWTATEQGMLQAAYDALRTFGLLT